MCKFRVSKINTNLIAFDSTIVKNVNKHENASVMSFVNDILESTSWNDLIFCVVFLVDCSINSRMGLAIFLFQEI